MLFYCIMIKKDICSRQEERKDVVRPIYFTDNTSPDTYAFSMNISPCGLCLITNNHINHGETLHIYSKFFWDRPRKATVMWMEEVNSRVYRIGMSLCNSL